MSDTSHNIETGPDVALGLLDAQRRTNWVRLRTLVGLRWIAITGQTTAITLTPILFDLQLNIGFCLMVIGVSVVWNLIAIFVYPESKRLSERELTFMLLFDTAQLAALLYFTGGLHNPFALLMLVPVTIAATALRTSATIVVGAGAIVFSTLVTWFYVPLHTQAGVVMKLADVFVYGFWTAIVIGVFFLGGYARRVASEINSMSEALLAAQMALAREQKITDLAGVVAATAHELGTPLATIKLTSRELAEDLPQDSDLQSDALLIADQADRCRDILRSMGRAGKDDLYMHHAPLMSLLREAAEPHLERGIDVHFTVAEDSSPLPTVFRRPEIIHGIRNLVQNAVDFAQADVEVICSAKSDSVKVTIKDDGHGFPPQVIGRIGDPYIRQRSTEELQKARPEYHGMGLGLFIAKTLLERTGAELTFSNFEAPVGRRGSKSKLSGAIVEVQWARASISPSEEALRRAVGENQPFLDA